MKSFRSKRSSDGFAATAAALGILSMAACAGRSPAVAPGASDGARSPRTRAVTVPGTGEAAAATPSHPGVAEAPRPTSEPVPGQAGVSRRQIGAAVLEGVPPLSESLRVGLAPYLAIRSARLRDLDRRGKTILITSRLGDTEQVHLVRTPLGARTQVTFASEPVEDALLVPDTTDAFIYVADRGGDEQFQIYRVDMERGLTTRLTDGKSRNGFPVWSGDGTKLAFHSNARNGRDFDIWLCDGRDPASARLVAEGHGHWSPLSFSGDGTRLLVRQLVSVSDMRLFVVDVASGALEAVMAEEPAAAAPAAAFSGRGDKLYVATDREGEFASLYELDLARHTWRPLTAEIPWDVAEDQLAVSPDGRRLALVTNEEGASVLRTMTPASRRAAAVPGIPRGRIRDLRFASGGRVLGFTLETPTRPGDAYTYEMDRKRLTRWTESELGGLGAERLVEPTLVRYKSFDGIEVPAFYYRPSGAGPFPVIIQIHGGPESQEQARFHALVQHWVAVLGAAVLLPNVRGSRGYGKTYLSLDNGRKREDSVKDIGALLDWIAQRPELGGDRVAVFGGSYGGYMVLASLVHYSDRLACGAESVGISNFVTFLENTKDYRRDLRRVEYGDERDPEMRAFLAAISPLHNIGKIAVPLFVAQGANDPRVPASESAQIVASLRQAGRQVWSVLFANEGHGAGKRENRDLHALITAQFLSACLR